MTRLTAAIIATDENVFASYIGPVHGRYGIYIGMDETPSGYKRPRDLLSSKPVFKTRHKAKHAGQALIKDVRKNIENLLK